MRFVVDTNIAVSLLKKDSFTRDLAKRYALELYSHPFILKEFDEHSEEFSLYWEFQKISSKGLRQYCLNCST